MKKIIASLIVSTIPCVTFASSNEHVIFDNPTGTPFGAPSWVNIPIHFDGAEKFCNDQGFKFGHVYTAETMYGATHVKVDESGEWEFIQVYHTIPVFMATSVECYGKLPTAS